MFCCWNSKQFCIQSIKRLQNLQRQKVVDNVWGCHLVILHCPLCHPVDRSATRCWAASRCWRVFHSHHFRVAENCFDEFLRVVAFRPLVGFRLVAVRGVEVVLVLEPGWGSRLLLRFLRCRPGWSDQPDLLEPVFWIGQWDDWNEFKKSKLKEVEISNKQANLFQIFILFWSAGWQSRIKVHWLSDYNTQHKIMNNFESSMQKTKVRISEIFFTNTRAQLGKPLVRTWVNQKCISSKILFKSEILNYNLTNVYKLYLERGFYLN